jgi:hypothetical protein
VNPITSIAADPNVSPAFAAALYDMAPMTELMAAIARRARAWPYGWGFVWEHEFYDLERMADMIEPDDCEALEWLLWAVPGDAWYDIECVDLEEGRFEE